MKNATKINALVLLCALLLSLLLGEIAVRIAAANSQTLLCKTFSDPSHQYLCGLEYTLGPNYFLHNRTTGITFDICDSHDAELGWVPKKNCNEPPYHTNSKGFRGTQEYALQTNATRIVVLGDSFAFGVNNEDDETYAHYLESHLSQSLQSEVEVLNLGVQGYGPDQMYWYYNREGARYNPDIVVLAIFLPDIHRVVFDVLTVYFRPKFLYGDGVLTKDTNSKIPSIEEALLLSAEIKNKPRSYLFSLGIGHFNKFMRLASGYKEETAITLAIVDKLNAELKANNQKLLVMLLPERNQIEFEGEDYYGVMPKLISHLEENRIPYVNMQPPFRELYAKNGTIYYQGHMKREGNDMIGSYLSDASRQLLKQ